MSDFPDGENYKKCFSPYHIKVLSNYYQNIPFNIIVKKLKNQYLYDIDGFKYVDFYLNNGAVIYGHSYKVLTHFIKNGISCGVESDFHNKFETKLIKYFERIINFNNIAFFDNLYNSLLAIINFIKPDSILVNTNYLFNLLKFLFPYLNILKCDKIKSAKLMIFEPLDMDNNLSHFDHQRYDAEYYCSFESRVAFRIKYGFINNLENSHIIISSNNISNGLNSSILLSRFKIEGEIIPLYKSLAILETLKFYKRKINYEKFELMVKLPNLLYKNKSIFILDNKINYNELIKRGILINGNLGFISFSHTKFDIIRLKKAILNLL